jgi:putative Holliday junction resolvase
MASWLGLDLGEKRVGVAIADESSRVATPVTTLDIRGRKHLADELTKLVEAYHVTKIVVGLPKTLKGEMGPAAHKIVETVEWLKASIDQSWVFWDERLSTQEVERILIAADVRPARRKQMRDQLAAQRILQSYMDSHRDSEKEEA